MTIEALARSGKASEKQVYRRWKEIGGVTKENGVLVIPDGTRYPIRRPRKIDTYQEKLYFLLKAINTYRYIDEKMLLIPKNSFDVLIKELLSFGWIQENGTNNEFGANKYDATYSGSVVARKKKYAAIKDISEAVASVAGHFAGGIAAELVG